MEKFQMPSPLGIITILGDELGVCKIKIEENAVADIDTDIPFHLIDCVRQLEAYFEGKVPKFDFLLNPPGTSFQKTVWQALIKIPYGKTISYMDLAKKIGDPKATRAVAAANGKNPLWIVVPCHRVIGSDGSLTGYAGGLSRKKWLLEFENPTTQQSLF